MMNKITDQTFSLSRNGVNELWKYIFDDAEEDEGGHYKHDEYFVTLVAEVDLEWAATIIEKLNLTLNRPENREVTPDMLVGNWMAEGTRSPNNGFYWDYLSEIVRVEKVVETITVTKWKPIVDETAPSCSCKQPQSKVCLPE